MDDEDQHERARELRNNMTDAELKLWYYLRGRRLKNIKFRRQEPVGDYIVDFVSYELNLIIEVDGGQHLEQKDYDKKRTEWLKQEDFTVVRFWNDEVLENTRKVLRSITEKIQKLQST